jgi:hypothetical protein
MNDYAPERVAEICRISVETIEHLAHRYGTTRPTFIRLNYGLQRHAGGGSAVRAISILPASPARGTTPAAARALDVRDVLGARHAALERKDLSPAGTRTINMSRLGEALTRIDDPPVKAMIVLQLESRLHRARSRERAGRPAPRRSLHRRPRALPDRHRRLRRRAAAGDDAARARRPAQGVRPHYVMFNARAIEPLGEALPNTEIFRRLAAKMQLDFPSCRKATRR